MGAQERTCVRAMDSEPGARTSSSFLGKALIGGAWVLLLFAVWLWFGAVFVMD